MKIEIDIQTKDDIMRLLEPLIKDYCDPFLGEKYPEGKKIVDSFNYGEPPNRLYTLDKADNTNWNWFRIKRERTLEELIEYYNILKKYII